MMALGSHYHPQQEPAEGTEVQSQMRIVTPALRLDRCGKAADDFHSASMHLGSIFRALLYFHFPPKRNRQIFFLNVHFRAGPIDHLLSNPFLSRIVSLQKLAS